MNCTTEYLTIKQNIGPNHDNYLNKKHHVIIAVSRAYIAEFRLVLHKMSLYVLA